MVLISTGRLRLSNQIVGIGRFTILDSSIVEEADLGVNFFLEESSLGGFRAEQCCNYLKELNPDVEGYFVTEPLESFIARADALKPFTLILVASHVDPEILSKLSQHATATQIALFYLHSVGFYSHFSIQLPTAFPIVDTHPDPESTTDIRILAPWKELVALAEEHTHGLDEMDDEQHGHVPYLILLLHYIEVWKSSHDGKPPQNYKEKKEFAQLVASAARKSNPEGGEENYDEAVAAVMKNMSVPSPSSEVKAVFSADECRNLIARSATFWVIANAVSQFFSTHGVLPLPGSVPDMKAKSADYIRLQSVYKQKAREDVAEVVGLVRELEAKLGRDAPIDERDVEQFCKNAAHIKLVRGRSLQIARPGEGLEWTDRAKVTVFKLTDTDSLILLYITFLAYDSFRAAHPADPLQGCPRAPGDGDGVAEADAEKLAGIAHKFLNDLIKQAGTFVEEPEYSELKGNISNIAQEM